MSQGCRTPATSTTELVCRRELRPSDHHGRADHGRSLEVSLSASLTGKPGSSLVVTWPGLMSGLPALIEAGYSSRSGCLLASRRGCPCETRPHSRLSSHRDGHGMSPGGRRDRHSPLTLAHTGRLKPDPETGGRIYDDR